MQSKTLLLVVCCLSILLWSCKQQYAYRSKVRVNPPQLVQAKPVLDTLLNEKEWIAKSNQAEASANLDGFSLPNYLPEVQLNFGKNKEQNYKQLNQKVPRENKSKYAPKLLEKPKEGANILPIIIGSILLLASIYIMFTDFIIGIFVGYVGLMILFLHFKYRKSEVHIEPNKKPKQFENLSKEEQLKRKQRLKLFCTILLILTLCAIFLFNVFFMAVIWSLFAPALLGAGLVAKEYDYNDYNSSIDVMARMIGGIASLILLLLILYVFFITSSFAFLFIGLTVAYVSLLLGRIIAKALVS